MRGYLAAGLAAVVFALGGGSVSASVVDFEDGYSSGNKYFEDGFVFEQLGSGNVSTPRGCVYEGVNSECMLLQNSRSGKIVKMYREDGGAFDLLSFLYDGRDGQGPALYVSTETTGGTLFSEDNVANDMISSGPLDQFKNVTMIFFRDADNGSARVDSIHAVAVPLPAAGFLMLVGLGALGVMRRRQRAA